MNRKEHLLTIAAEECAEVAQCLSKALRFGLSDVKPGQGLTNAERIVSEFSDLVGVMEMLFNEGHIPSFAPRAFVQQKKERIEEWLKYSEQAGTLGPELLPKE